MSVATLLAVPAARGLFQRAIVQSGGADFVLSRDESARVAAVALDALGVTRGSRVDALVRGDVSAVVQAQRAAVRLSVDRGLRGQTPQFGMTLMPVVDGDYLPQRPVDALAAGAARDVPLLASVTRDEWNLFMYQPQFAGGRNQKVEQLDDAALARLFERALPGIGAEALAFYRTVGDRRNNDRPADLLCWLETDRMFAVPTQRMLAAQASHQADVYAARFDWECPQFGGVLGACHVVDVPFVFGGTEAPVGQFFTGGGAIAAGLSADVMRCWGNFARTGRPGPVQGSAWPRFGAECAAMSLGARCAAGTVPGAAVSAFWHFLR